MAGTLMVLFIIVLVTSIALPSIGWFTLLVHYPLFRTIGRHHFKRFGATEAVLHTLVLRPLIIIDSLVMIILLFHPMQQIQFYFVAAAVLCSIVIWIIFFRFQAKSFRTLSTGFHPHAYRVLLRSQCFLTVLLSMRAILALAFLCTLLHKY